MLLSAGVFLWVDRQVGLAFAKLNWTLPARVYASAVDLYEGASLAPDALGDTLSALSYAEHRSLEKPGRYWRRGNVFRIHTRGHEFPDSFEPPRQIEIEFAGDRVNRLRGLNGNKLLHPIRIEPLEIGRVHPRTFEDRVLIRIDEVPEQLIQLLVAVEDRRFLSHFGVDLIAIGRAFYRNVKAGAIREGASTITQQLAKNMFLSGERSYKRKIHEILIALSIERRLSKPAILEAYLNEVFLGQDGNRAVHGFGLAARYFFAKSLTELNTAEIASLVGMVKAPTTYNPRHNPDAARERRDTVLAIAHARDLISAQELARTRASPLRVSAAKPDSGGLYADFMQLVREQLGREYRDSDLMSAGMRIYTSLDTMAQHATAMTLRSALAAVESQRKISAGSLQSAVVIIDPRTAEVKALLGGRNPQRADFNRALRARRAIGSLIKPFVYLTALEQTERFNLLSPLEDAPVSLTSENGERWTPRNFDRKSHGTVSLAKALINSYNLATVKLGLDLGIETIVERLHDLGLETPIDKYPSLLLGALALSPIEVTALYQSLANDGFRMPLRAIRAVVDDEGRTLSRYAPEIEQTIKPNVAFLMRHILSRVVTEGTAGRVARKLPEMMPLAGKTGTSNAGRDSWFAGFGANYLAVVWVGRDDNGVTGLTGATGALDIWMALARTIRFAPIEFSPATDLEWAYVSAEGRAILDGDCDGAIRIPLAQPHGLTPQPHCSASRLSGNRFWDRLKSIFQ